MTNSKYLTKLVAGIVITLIGMMLISQLAGVLIRGLDVSESFVSSVSSIMMLMGCIATVSYILWYVRLGQKMQRAINPGLVQTRHGSTVVLTATVSLTVYILLAIVNIGLKDWSAMVLCTCVGIIAVCMASGLLHAAMAVAEKEF